MNKQRIVVPALAAVFFGLGLVFFMRTEKPAVPAAPAKPAALAGDPAVAALLSSSLSDAAGARSTALPVWKL
ncbi:MAG TPA: hypothetical protein VIT92_12035, partial [Burkholderiaceae bacterium]